MNAVAPFAGGLPSWLEHETQRLLGLCVDHDSATSDDTSWTLQTLDRLSSEVGPTQAAVAFTDYNRNNVTLEFTDGSWKVSGVFDLMECYYGDPLATAAREFAMALDDDVRIAEAFLQAYVSQISIEAQVERRLQRGLIYERLLVWEYFTRLEHKSKSLPKVPGHTLRDWLGSYLDAASSAMSTTSTVDL